MRMFRLLLLGLLAVCSTISGYAYEYFESDGIYYSIEDNNTLSVRNGSTKYEGSVIIPSEVYYNGVLYSVTSIDWSAFYGCSGLTSITIPNSVTCIRGNAFRYCSGLTSITIPSSVTSIGYGAFSECSGLTKAEFPSIKNLCDISFEDSESNPLYHAHHLYIAGEEITNLVIPNSVTSIGDYTFSGCSDLTPITIPNSVTSIGSSAFHYTGWYNNQPNGLLYLDNCLLGFKGKVDGDIVINGGTRIIASSAFKNCSGLTSITIPNSVTSIGNYAFESCSGLTSISIPNGVTSIGSRAFSGCSGLTSISIPNGVTSIGSSAFSGCI